MQLQTYSTSALDRNGDLSKSSTFDGSLMHCKGPHWPERIAAREICRTSGTDEQKRLIRHRHNVTKRNNCRILHQYLGNTLLMPEQKLLVTMRKFWQMLSNIAFSIDLY